MMEARPMTSESKNDTESVLRHLHRAYCEASGNAPPYLSCERRLLAFHNQGFAEDDIRLVLWYVRRENAKMNGAKWGTGFGQLFQQAEDGIFERFGDLLGTARGAQRKADFKAAHSYPADKASVLWATGRPDTKPLPEPKMAKEVVAGLLRKGFEDALKEAEESTKLHP